MRTALHPDSTALHSDSTALYPGSFDPAHNGHVDVVVKTSDLFKNVVVAVMHNPAKPAAMFSDVERVAMLQESLAHLSNVTVTDSDDLVVNLATALKANVIVKGLRSGTDFEVEMRMAHMNQSVSGIGTIFIPCAPNESFIASNFIREIVSRGGDCSHLVPTPVAERLRRVGSQ